jgi:hypothetical protein
MTVAGPIGIGRLFNNSGAILDLHNLGIRQCDCMRMAASARKGHRIEVIAIRSIKDRLRDACGVAVIAADCVR